MKKCCIENCDNDAKGGRGMCRAHYMRWWRNGDPNVFYGRGYNSGRPRSGSMDKQGYWRITLDDGRRVLEHVYLAEKALGRPLPKGVEVHHVNGIKCDNTPSNLVICPDRAYHFLLHRRARMLGYEE